MTPAENSSYRPPASNEIVRANMKAQKRRDTACELAIRRLLHAKGVRYRVDFRPLKSERFRVDIGWKNRKLAVFIDGCFWHCCPEHTTLPKANHEWWADKLRKNVERDRRTDAVLMDEGWTVLRFWEHEPHEDVVASILTRL